MSVFLSLVDCARCTEHSHLRDHQNSAVSPVVEAYISPSYFFFNSFNILFIKTSRVKFFASRPYDYRGLSYQACNLLSLASCGRLHAISILYYCFEVCEKERGRWGRPHKDVPNRFY